MNFNEINKVYFIGIGGIGMSALARYFHSQSKEVAGYDKTRTKLTIALEQEGIDIHYHDLDEGILAQLNRSDTLVVYTPAVPKDFGELTALQEEGYHVIKRAKALGIISEAFETFAVAGTHGKTTTSSILAHVLNQTTEGVNAFIGGITSNYDSNCIINKESNRVVVEADEFDRSFLTLYPDNTIVTSMDADHLDIYGDGDHLTASFNEFINQTKSYGVILVNSKIDLTKFELADNIRINTYGVDGHTDWRLHALKYADGKFFFDIISRSDIYRNIEFGLPGQHNAENATAVFALCIESGVSEDEIREAFRTFKGVKRRFDFKLRRDDMVVIDDYAHHPTEIEAFLRSVRKLYPEKKITAVFQPHLYSRTRDFMAGFANTLALADELYLLPIYPARELPIEGITSAALFEEVNLYDKYLSSKETIVEDLKKGQHEVICIIGAGDIDTIVEPITQAYT